MNPFGGKAAGELPSQAWLAVGILNEAISRFSAASGAAFWREVCKNLRWVIPIGTVAVLRKKDGAEFRCIARAVGSPTRSGTIRPGLRR